MKQILCYLILIGLAASRSTIPELYKKNNGYFASEYSTTYKNPVVSTEFGVSSEAGDINNDGIPDILLGAPASDNGKGAVYVIYGKPGSLRQFNSMDDFQPSDGFIIKGSADGQKFGFSVGAAGDINGDGIDDIIIGCAYQSERVLQSEARAAYVLFGRRSSSEFPSVVDVDRLSPTQGFKIVGTIAGGGPSEFSVSGAGDVNGDGISDLIIGAFSVGHAYVIFGSKQGFTDMTLPPVAGKGFTVLGSGFDQLGKSVRKVGDFNGDGVDDLIIGAPGADMGQGRAFVIYGRRQGFSATINPDYLKASDGMMIQGSSKGHYFGSAVSGAGDFNGDGLQDVVIGAYNANGNKGAAYVIFGSRENPGVLSVNDLKPSRGFNIMSSDSSRFGLSVGGGRDINGDGKSDIIIGAPASQYDAGAVFIIYGSSTSTNILMDNLQPSQGFAMTGQGASRFGEYVAMLKDINGDGVDDFIVGAKKANGGNGAAYLFYLPWTCPARCPSCTKPNICDDLVCPDKCAKCSSPTTCDAWICPNKCTKCSSPTTCDAWRCSENCISCSKADECDSCISGFALINNKCEVCSDSDTHFMKNGYCFEVFDKWGPIKNFFGGLFG